MYFHSAKLSKHRHFGDPTTETLNPVGPNPSFQEILKVSSFHSCLFLWLVYKQSGIYFFFFLLVMDLLDTTVSSFGGLGVKLEEGASTGSLITVMSTS